MKLSTLKLFRTKEDTCSQELNILKAQINEATLFIDEIKKGNFEDQVSENLSKSDIGLSLETMKVHLAKIAKEDQIRSWLNVGLAKFSDILRNKKSLAINELADDILSNLVKYINANQGAIFILENGAESEQYLSMFACYAYNRKKYIGTRIELGEGLAGQCVLEKESIFLQEIPSDYIKITSGLGESTPREVFISPLKINDDIFGVIELASLNGFLPHHLEFVEKLSENIAATIKSVKNSEHTHTLLNASQQQSEELRAQEEEMRQNMEEMLATQEEMQRKSDALECATAEMQGIISGVNSSMATIEFTPQGEILNANKIFLDTMKYKLDQVVGRHHRIFVPAAILEGEEYKTFWNRLASGEAITGIFTRVTSEGNTVLLNVVYSPVLDRNGTVVKVIKFATDITAEQAAIAETNKNLADMKRQNEDLKNQEIMFRQFMQETQEQHEKENIEFQKKIKQLELSNKKSYNGHEVY